MPIPASLLGVGSIERAVDQIIEHLQDQLNGYIDLVYEEAQDGAVNLPHVSSERYYISEAIEPLRPPAVFVVAERTDDDLGVQNVAAQTHRLFVAILAEDLGSQLLQRKAWRYGKALWLALHDQSIGDCKVLVRSRDYGPTLEAVTAQAGQRLFRKDVTLRCDVLHYERFR